MRVSIVARERPRILRFYLPPDSAVLARVQFDPVERAIIRKYKLLDHVIIARKPRVVTEIIVVDGREKTVRREVDQNIRLAEFYERDAEFPVAHPAAAHAFIKELIEALNDLNDFLTANGRKPAPIHFRT